MTVELAIAKSINLTIAEINGGAQHTEAQMRELVQSGEVNLMTPFKLMKYSEDKVTGVALRNFDTKECITHDADELLFLFGLNKNWVQYLNGSLI